MLSKKQRLTTSQVKEVMEKGRVVHSSLFMARILPVKAAFKNLKTPLKTSFQISAVAPAKIFKQAVKRNKVRRLIYKGIQNTFPTSANRDALPHIQGVIFAKNGILEKKQQEVFQDLKALFVKSGVLK